MAFVIIDPCIDVKDGDCTEVCPVECIYEGGRMFYIQPDECIHCALCETICPVDAIRSEYDLEPAEERFLAINRDYFGPDVTGLGKPGGWGPDNSTTKDHPTVAGWSLSQGKTG